MLSKILRGEQSQMAQPLPWRHAGGGPPLAAPPASHQTPQTRPTASGFRQIVDPADDEAASLRARIAEREASMEQRLREAREQGFREGEAAGRSQASSQVEPLLGQLARSIDELAQLRSKLRHQAEGDLLKLSVAIARKVLHRELNADPEALAGLIHVALSKIRVQEILRVRVHPQHQAMVIQQTQRLTGGAHLEVCGDPRLPLGGVLVETSRGEFDASIDVQLREIETGLADRLAARA